MEIITPAVIKMVEKNISVKLVGKILEIKVPFHRRFPGKLKDKTSKCYWDPEKKVWNVILQDESDVRGALWALQFCGFINKEQKIKAYREIVQKINQIYKLNWKLVW